VLFAQDPKRVAHFYEVVAGMKVTHAAADIIVLESQDHQLMVHPIPPRIAATIEITMPPKRRTRSAVKLVFAVQSIAAARRLAPGLGGRLNPAQRMFEARGFRACDGHDPEGNVIQFREDADAPAKAVRRKPSRHGEVDYATVRELALTLPEVTDSSTLRGMAFKARGKLLACKAVHRSAEPQSLMVRVGTGERDRLIGTEPEIYYMTPHYLASEAVLVRLTRIDRTALQALFAIAWQFVAGTAAARRKSAKRRKTASVFRYL
jgi:predicted enzyme related to lactoylglutathione lyase